MKKSLLLISCIMWSFMSIHTAIAASKYPDVDREIFAMQRGFIDDIRSLLHVDMMQGLKQTGSMTLKAKIGTPEASGSLSLSLTELSTTSDAKSRNVEMAYRGTAALEISGVSSDYDSYDKKTQTYKKVPYEFSTTITFDMKVVVTADGDMYLTLSKLGALSRGDMSMKKSLDEAMQEVGVYIGKTLKVPGSYTSYDRSLNSLALQTNMLKALDILSEKSLFAVVSKKGETYALSLDRAVMKDLGWIMPKEFRKSVLTYARDGTKQVIRFAEKRNPKKNYMALVSVDGVRTFDLVVGPKRPRSSDGAILSVSKRGVYLSAKDASTSLLLDWRGGKFDMSMKTKGDTYGHGPAYDLTIRGDLAMDGSLVDLGIMWDGKSIGSLKGKTIGNMSDFAFTLATTSSLFDLMVDLKAQYMTVRGDYQILPPKIYELLGDL